MLLPTYLARFNKEEVIEYLRSTKDICYDNDPMLLNIKVQVADLIEVVEQLDDALVYDRKSSFTKELEDLDLQRDNAVTALRYGFLMNSLHPDPVKKAAGQLLLEHLDTYGSSIARLNYEAESTILINISEDYETQPKLVKALKATELTDLATILEGTNIAFRTKYQERITIESAAEKLSFTAVKPKALAVYEKLYKRINALTELDEKNVFDTLKNELNTLTKRYQQIINTRKTNVNENDQTQENIIGIN